MQDHEPLRSSHAPASMARRITAIAVRLMGAMLAGPRPTPSPGATTLPRVFTFALERPLSGTARNPPPLGFKPERPGAERERWGCSTRERAAVGTVHD